MGGIVSFIIPVIAAFVFLSNGRLVLLGLSIVVATAGLASWRLMAHHAFLLARDRIWCELQERGEEPEDFESLARMVKIEPNAKDIADTPNWIAGVSMIATLVGVILLIVSLVVR